MARRTAKPAASGKSKPAPATVAKAKATAKADLIVPIVGLGASAGGLQAYSAFLDAAPSDTGAAFVLVHHVDPDHKSLMADLLAKHTDMPVVLAEDQIRVQPDHIYVIPPKKYIEVKAGVLHLSEPRDRRGTRMPIDFFLRSLAQDSGQYAIAVILSGTGSDGSAAIREIKEQGGIVLVQEPAEAPHDGMPRSAIATGAVDYVVEIPKMPDIIVSYVRHPFIQNAQAKKVLGEDAKSSLDQIIAVLRAHSPVNFDLYKDGTLLRRIERRMALRHMENSGDYLALLQDSEDEAKSLCADLLISVSSFFRDADAFEYLDKTVIEGLVKSHDPGQPVRIWIPGCATGEEAYSLAILFIEKITNLRKDVRLQIFASDVDERGLTIARNGVYPDSISEDVSAIRLKRFFTKEDHSYRVVPELRDAVVFANQNILSDAPFSKLDLISCRNLMIYLTPDAQERVIQMFHFALNDGGILFLGMSETTGTNSAHFQPLSKKYRIYKRVDHARNRSFDFPLVQRPFTNAATAPTRRPFQATGNKLAQLSQSLLVEHYAPAAVLVNDQSEALYFEGPTDDYLRVPSGETSRDLLAMAREGLRARLSTAIRAARTKDTGVRERATITRNGERVGVEIQVHPVTLDEARLFLATFADQPTTPVVSAAEESNAEINRQLEQELETTRTDLRNTISDYEQTTEELKAVNEEAMSMNEEFQSTNEELETSKEELQSLNEELTTLNTQLQQKIDEERRMSDDLNNLLSSSGIATLFLDTGFKIMRFTPATRELFNLISKDVERPFSDITGKVKDPDLLKDAELVLETLVPAEREVESVDGRWFVRRILPYRTQRGKIDGVVVTFVDVSDLKTLQRETANAREFAESIISTMREPMLVLDDTFTILSASRSFDRMFPTEGAGIIGRDLFSIQNRQWDVPRLREFLETILPEKAVVEAFDLQLDTFGLGRRDMLLSARRIEGRPKGQECILLVVEDVTDEKKAQRAIQDRETRLRAILDAAPEAILTIDEHGIVGTFSSGAEGIFGFKANEVLGQNVKMLMPEPDRSRHDGYLEHYIKTGEKKIIGIGREMDAGRKDGSRVPIRLTVSELEIDGARHFLGIIHDLTVDKKRQAELQRAQKMEAVGQLTGGLAHDFNNLLTVVIGNLELLEMRTDDVQLRELIDEALEASSLGAALTSQLLSFSKSQSLAPESVALNDLVRTMLPLLERTLNEQINIETRLADDLQATLADPGQIESAILNLAINARDAMPNGGTLTLETRNVALDADFAATQIDVMPGDYVCLSVTDTGVGMTPETQSRAFEPFFTTKGPRAGSGLGLSMVYGFAKQSGGHVAIYSEAGQGATINLFLPVAVERVGTRKALTSEKVSETGTETILVVEDDPKVRRLTVTRLEELQYKVVFASDGPQAMKILEQREDIDLVLSDVVMPGGMTGYDVAEKAVALRPAVKILLATGYSKGVEPNGKTRKGGYRTLRKPYGLQELARTLREVLD
ncbi:two-component system, chemotaxis family, CheB/CheR fusion protein [Jannaschia faecimaris]|uniref:Sensor protein FixL n=1 Tax=Jannaschia faecimaris TaxID=1244108 RepID=A0A1H3RGY5_9RHOB|nr:chemotaxis protein CheB [Jannaschia faecimaris]SDZ24605.1 two-component system, chemotaxis family, CheB/CheR fusion protein [Jannaschia faecimaris]